VKSDIIPAQEVVQEKEKEIEVVAPLDEVALPVALPIAVLNIHIITTTTARARVV